MVHFRLSFSLLYYLLGKLLVRSNEDRECIWIVLCLCYQIGGDEGCLSALEVGSRQVSTRAP